MLIFRTELSKQRYNQNIMVFKEKEHEVQGNIFLNQLNS